MRWRHRMGSRPDNRQAGLVRDRFGNPSDWWRPIVTDLAVVDSAQESGRTEVARRSIQGASDGMSPQTVLLLGCFGLGSVITYCWWMAIHVDLLRLRLIEIRETLIASIEQAGMTDDESYLRIRVWIEILIELAPYISMPVGLVFLRLHKPPQVSDTEAFWRGDGGWGQIKVEGNIPEVVRHARSELFTAVLMHLTTTPLNWVVFLYLSLSGRADFEPLISELASFGATYRAGGRLGVISK